MIGFGTSVRGPSPFSALPPPVITGGYTSIYFGENQLSRNLVGLSPLLTAHPRSFQPSPVRASILCYQDFTLAMSRSSRFGSAPCNSIALLRLAFATAPPNGLTSPHNVTHGLIMQKVRGHTFPYGHSAPTACRHTVSGSLSLPFRGSFHLSLAVLVHYRSMSSI